MPPPLVGASLLLRPLFAEGTARPGTGGAPPIGGPEEGLDSLATIGAERSLTTGAFFNFLPFSISPSKLACKRVSLCLVYSWNSCTNPSFRSSSRWS